MLLVYLFLALFTYAFKFIKNEKAEKLYHKASKSLYFSFLIRFAIEAYVELTICAWIQVREISQEPSLMAQKMAISGEAVSVVFAYTLLIILLAFPAMTLAILTIKAKRFDDPLFDQRFGAFLDGVDRMRKEARLFHFFFVLRRFILIFAFIVCENSQGIQILLITYSSSFMLVYKLVYSPFDDHNVNFIERANEVMVLVVTYFLISFSDFNAEHHLKQQTISRLYCIAIGVCVLLNFLFLLNLSVLRPVLKALRKKQKAKQI